MAQVNYKFILIGNSGVGKTSFFRKLSTGEFYEKNISTIGIEKKSFDLKIEAEKDGKTEEKKFNISLFDTAGQEKFRAITFNYFKGADGIFLLYDITDRQTFDNVEMWVDSIKQAIDSNEESKNAIVLIGNKLDLIEDGLKERQVTEDEARNISEKYNMIWGEEQSIKSIDFDKLTKLFEKYVGDIYKRIGIKKSNRQKIQPISKKRSNNRPGACGKCINDN